MQAFEQELVGKRQSIADVIANLETTSCPYTSMLAKRTRPVNQPHSWQAEKYKDVGHEGVADGKDVETFDSQDRLLLQCYGQKLWHNPAVSDFADEAEVAGVGGGEFARQKMIAMLQLKRKQERRFLSDSDTNLADKIYETRGAFSWVSNGAQTTFPVPGDVRTPAAQIYTGAFASFKESTLETMTASSFIQRKGPLDMDAFLGIYLKQRFTKEFTDYQEDRANYTSVRQFTRSADNSTFTKTIDYLLTDTGKIRLHTSSYLLCDKKTGAASATSHYSGIILDLDMTGLAYTRLPRILPQENRGGGPRAICDCIVLHMVDNPLGAMKITPTLP